MIDVYHATVDDFARAALQSLFYFNYLCGGPIGTGPSKSELQLRLVSRIGNSRRVVKLLDNIAAKVGLDTRVPHLEGETIFGSTKRKLDLPLGDDNDSHRHDQINYLVPKVGKGISPSQGRLLGRSLHSQGQGLSFVKSSNPSTVSLFSNSAGSHHSLACDSQVITRSGLPILESPCSDPLQWRIERVPSDSFVTCWGRFDGKRCNAKIAKYRRSIAAPTFLGIERHSKSKESRQVQVWFCLTRLDRCVLGPGAKWIINYPDIPDKWPMRCGTSLTHAEVTSLELGGFVLEDGVELVVPPIGPINNVSPSHDPAIVEGTPGKLPRDAFGFATEISLQFVLGHSRVHGVPDLISMNSALDGDKCPTMRDGKPFRFIS